jgi:hypothetical protein
MTHEASQLAIRGIGNNGAAASGASLSLEVGNEAQRESVVVVGSDHHMIAIA